MLGNAVPPVGPRSIRLICPSCNAYIKTSVSSNSTGCAYIWCFFMICCVYVKSIGKISILTWFKITFTQFFSDVGCVRVYHFAWKVVRSSSTHAQNVKLTLVLIDPNLLLSMIVNNECYQVCLHLNMFYKKNVCYLLHLIFILIIISMFNYLIT